MEYGLKDNVLLKIRKVLSSFSGIEEAVIYGSRALGTYREGSDIDIALKANLSFEELLQVEKKLDRLMLPYTLDISLYHKLSNQDLLKHIDRTGKQLYVKEAVYPLHNLPNSKKAD